MYCSSVGVSAKVLMPTSELMVECGAGSIFQPQQILLSSEHTKSVQAAIDGHSFLKLLFTRI